jgi:hypothetical protein
MITLARYQLPNPELLIGFDLYYGLFQDIRYDIALSQGHNVDALEFEFVFFNESAHHFKCFASLTQDGTKFSPLGMAPLTGPTSPVTTNSPLSNNSPNFINVFPYKSFITASMPGLSILIVNGYLATHGTEGGLVWAYLQTPRPVPLDVVLRLLIRLQQIKTVQFPESFVNQNPSTVPIMVYLALAVFGPAARTVEQALGEQGHGTQAAGKLDDAFAAK